MTCEQVLVLQTHLGSTMGWQGQLLFHCGLQGLAGIFKENISPFPYSDQPALISLGSQQL